LGCVWAAFIAGCGAEPEASQEAQRVLLPVVVDSGGMGRVVTDLGYEVEPTSFQVALHSVEFTVEGELLRAAAPSWGARVVGLLVSRAWAHPGHYVGGEVLGELPGRFVFDWAKDDGRRLGTATLLEGDYKGANFAFARAGSADGVPSGAMFGRSAWLEGVARKDGAEVRFEVALEQDEATWVVGLPFEAAVREGGVSALGLRAKWQEPVAQETLLDGLDFVALDADGDGLVQLLPGAEGYERAHRLMQLHDFYEVVAR
jgi:hypothetical protein